MKTILVLNISGAHSYLTTWSSFGLVYYSRAIQNDLTISAQLPMYTNIFGRADAHWSQNGVVDVLHKWLLTSTRETGAR